jgi:hypothetical protein
VVLVVKPETVVGWHRARVPALLEVAITSTRRQTEDEC